MLQKITEESETGYIVHLEQYLKLFYKLINTNKGYSMGDENTAQSFIKEIGNLVNKIDQSIGGDVGTFGNIIPLEYLMENSNVENLGKIIEKYTYDRVDAVIDGTIIDKSSPGSPIKLTDINHDNIRVIGKYKYLYHNNKCYMLKDEQQENGDIYFKHENNIRNEISGDDQVKKDGKEGVEEGEVVDEDDEDDETDALKNELESNVMRKRRRRR